jgi:fatty acid desaturase
MHEGSHYHFFRNRKVNDAVSELLLAWPLFVTTHAYRTSHFAHHRHVNIDRDPDFMRKQGSEWMFPKTWPALGLLFLKDVFGLNTYQQLLEASDLSDSGEGQSQKTNSYRIVRIVYYISMLAVVSYFHVWQIFLLLWIVPL